MVVVPTPTPLACPFVAKTLLMVALVISDEPQVTDFVMSWVVASENVPVAVN